MELIEREGLLAQLDSLFEEARAGAGRLALVGGEAGVGKTSLARAFVERLPVEVRTLWGSCDPLSTPRPLAPFYDMAPLAGLLERHPGRQQLLTAMLEELGLQSVMVVEDAQWADEATLEALRFVGRRIVGCRSLVVVTYRDDELGSDHPFRAVLGDLATASGCERLQVPVLTPLGVAKLAAGHAIEPGRLHHITGGNPFYVTEVLAAPGWTVPATVADAVLARAARLSPEARALLEVVSLAPGGLELTIAEAFVEDASQRLDECADHGVLVVADGLVGFRHELGRLAIEDSVRAGTRRELHARLLRDLEGAPATDPARLAHHAEAAGVAEAVLAYAPLAAERASSLGAHREAAAQYARALRFVDESADERLGELLERRAYACYLTGEFDEALSAQERAVERHRSLGDWRAEGDSLRSLSRLLRYVGRTEEAARAGRQAVAVLERLRPGHELAMAYANVSHLCMSIEDGEGTVAWGERALELAGRLDDVESRVYALTNIGTVEFLAGAGTRKLEESLALAREAGLDEHVGRAFVALVWWAPRGRSYATADRHLKTGLAYCSERGLDLWRLYLLAYRARSELDRGRWAEAAEYAELVIRDPRSSPVPRVVALSVLGLVRARRGDADVWPPLDEAWSLAEPTEELQRLEPAAAARAEAAWLERRPDGVAKATDLALEIALLRRAPWVVGELAAWRRRAGLLEEVPAECAEPYALEIRGDWARAAAHWTSLESPYEAALVLAEADDDDAVRRSLDELHRLGGRPAAALVSQRLRERGVRRLPRGPRAVTQANPASLTTRQLEVLALVEAGLTNAEIAERLFITEKTAGHHVSAILGKLGVRSRSEAGATARKMGISSTQT